MTDVVVVGAGPAGRALSHRLLRRGVAVTVVDPRPEVEWRATYACWTDEIPHWLPPEVVGAQVDSVAMRVTETAQLRRGYTVFDTVALRRALALHDARILRDHATVVGEHHVTTRSGATITASTVIDARGLPGHGPRQTASGVVVPRAQARPFVGDTEAVLMDWTPASSDDSAGASFLYAVPLDADRVLLEETCLAGDPPVPVAHLRARLDERLSGHPSTPLATETVSFALRGPAAPWRVRPIVFGSRGGLLHPATGYSVGESLTAADGVAAAIADGHDPLAGLWPQSARVVYRLRSVGLRAVLSLSPDATRRMFDAFAELPLAQQRAYLSGRDDAAGTARAMAALFTGVDNDIRRSFVRALRGRRVIAEADQ
ncbi:lycopene cyclase family protein [Gordonia rhizosphera]|uniref:lycopene cyclase family protein n=1 Tax=Gordonia rhizosphera TaxID=83341 RepID=UPI00068B7E13|nr:lycopene cyclase family protein [Gordonia rhizosphera]